MSDKRADLAVEEHEAKIAWLEAEYRYHKASFELHQAKMGIVTVQIRQAHLELSEELVNRASSDAGKES